MNQRYAVIDIGTLKVKCLVAEVDEMGELVERYKSNNLTCFGCDMNRNGGWVSEKNLAKTIEELRRLKTVLGEYQVAKFQVVSTHVMRLAKNREDILQKIKEELGWEVENITQEQEASLFYLAVMKGFTNTNQRYAIVDVGGGSVQVLIGLGNYLEKTLLLPTGAQYLHATFTENSDAETSFTKLEDIEKMKDYIVEQLMPVEKNLEVPIVYGSSNIIDLMKAIQLPLEEHRESRSHPYKVYARQLEEFMNRMLPVTYEEREKLFDFQKGYMWGIDKAFLNIVTLAEHLESPYIIPSNANIAQGVVWEMIND